MNVKTFVNEISDNRFKQHIKGKSKSSSQETRTQNQKMYRDVFHHQPK